ncbi:uncharacterized protein [Lepeophtheirus salmonis]|uniref:uncharacterized protein n=1 Tax=Lepeophtheirus salmonis TaxID=72036 RepID=UPI001AE90CAB|nr:uncharacterized protein LOC121127519 [Lepeophtheirus salmonis]
MIPKRSDIWSVSCPFGLLLLLFIIASGSCSVQIIASSDPALFLLPGEPPNQLFCESDSPFDLCIWSYNGDKCVGSSGSSSYACTDFPEGITLHIETTERKCILQIELPKVEVHEGEYTCLLGSFDDISTGRMDMMSKEFSIQVAHPASITITHSESGVLHVSNSTQTIDTDIICTSENGIPSISNFELYRNGIPIDGNDEGLFHLSQMGLQNDGDVLLCGVNQVTDDDRLIYSNQTSDSLIIQVLYPPQMVNIHEIRFMFEFIANPEAESIDWELFDDQNNTFVYHKTETEVKVTGEHKYLITLIIDLENITVCEYILTVDNGEGILRHDTHLKSFNSSLAHKSEQNVDEDSTSENLGETPWSLIFGILGGILFIVIVGIIAFVIFHQCKYSQGHFYSSANRRGASESS